MNLTEFTQKTDLSSKPKKQRPILMGLGFLTIVAISLIITFVPIGGSESNDSGSLRLDTLQPMNKEQVIKLLGEPDEIVVNNDENYTFGYDNGISVSGTEQGVYEFFAQQAMIKKDSKAEYEIFGVGLGSSFDNNVNRLGKPNLSLVADQKKAALYILKDIDYLFILSTSYNSDLISDIQYASYNDSLVSANLDLGRLLVREFSEEGSKSNYNITDRQTSPNGVLYSMEGFNIWVDKQNVVKNINISTESVYNFRGLRMHDSIEKANQIFGDPITTSKGVSNTTRYTYIYEEGPNTTCLILISVNNDNNKIQFIEVQPRYTVNESTLLPSENTESVPIDMWATLDDYQKTSFNEYFSMFSEVGFGTNPYIKESEIRLFSDDELIKFAIAYNIENFEDRYGIDSDDHEFISIPDAYISDTILQLFDIDISHKSVSGYDYKNGKYLWSSYRWAKVYANTFSQVETLTNNGDGTYSAEVSIYTDNSYYGPDSTGQDKLAWYEPKESAWGNDSQYAYIGSGKAIYKDGDIGGLILTHYEVTSMY